MIKKAFLFGILSIFFLCSFGQVCQPPTSGSPGDDTPDDNYSYSNGSSFDFSYYFSDYQIAIFKNGFFEQAAKIFLTNKPIKYFEGNEKIDESIPIVIIPSGGLFGKENDTTLKTILQEYVRQGKIIIIFTQQYGTHYEKVVPIPEGSSLKALGWREDQSCFSGSAYHTTQNNVPHPIFSGTEGEVVNVGVDGYFSTIPAEATVLLRRKMNQEPVMISYPYGQGTVILTSLFSDYANAHSQMGGWTRRTSSVTC